MCQRADFQVCLARVLCLEPGRDSLVPPKPSRFVYELVLSRERIRTQVDGLKIGYVSFSSASAFFLQE